MRKKLIYIFFILGFLSGSSLTKAQWVLDYQFNPPGSQYLTSISIVDTNIAWVVTVNSLDSGKVYKKINSTVTALNFPGLYGPNTITAIDNNKAYLSAYYGKLYYTTNSGNNWQVRLDSSWGVTVNYGIAGNAPNFIATVIQTYDTIRESKFLKSRNNGLNWEEQILNLPADHYSYDLSITDSQHICIGVNCESNNCTELRYIFTTDGGLTWLTKTFPLVSNNTIIQAPVFNIQNQTGFTFSVGYYYYRYRTTNGGANWSSPEYFSLGNTEGLSGIKNVDSTQIWLCAKARNVYETRNDGVNWNEMTIPLSDSEQISCLDVIKSGSKFYAYIGTSRGGIFKLVEDISSIGINPISNEIPKTYSLSQNYPNPFNPSTNINFSIPKNSFVKISIYNVLGQLITELVNENKTPGNYSVEFDGTNLPSGLYLYKIQAGAFTETKKMLLIK
jgi:photosystem II stability/assembly factor-like uncharacterized protein